MSLILNIDTSTEEATVSIAENGIGLDAISHTNHRDHAGFLHTAIKDLLERNKLTPDSLSAVAVIAGPGSYTGLRVGMSAAKGLCYALNIPFLSVGTLNVMAHAVISSTINLDNDALYCPLIDARRMEVFTAILTANLEAALAPAPLILNESSFEEILKKNKIFFFGNGSAKFEAVCVDKNAFFISLPPIQNSLNKISFEYFAAQKFSNIADCEPFYLKEFQSSPDFLK